MAALRMASLWESRVSADEASASASVSSPMPALRGALLNGSNSNSNSNSYNNDTGADVPKKSVSALSDADMDMPVLETSSAITPPLTSSLAAFKAGAGVSPATTPEKSAVEIDACEQTEKNLLPRTASGKRPPLFPLRGNANADASVDLVASPVSDDAREKVEMGEEEEEEDDYVSVQEEDLDLDLDGDVDVDVEVDVDMDMNVKERYVRPAQGLRKLKEALAGLDTKLDGVQDALDKLAVRVAELQRGSGSASASAPACAMKMKAVVV